MAVGSKPIVTYGACLLLILLWQFCFNPVYPSKYIEHYCWLAFFCCFIALSSIRIFGFLNRPLKDLYVKEEERVIPLPERFKESVGNASIDIFSTDAMHFFYHEMAYAPRPIPQGYQAYTTRLDSINASFYSGPNRPEYVIIKPGSVISRHPFWDEIRTKFQFRSGYEIIDSFLLPSKPGGASEQYHLLIRKESTKPLQWHTASLPKRLPINSAIDCSGFKASELISIKIRYNYLGRLKRFFFQPEVLTCVIYYKDGAVSKYPATLPVLEGGIPLFARLEQSEDIGDFLRGTDTREGNRIEKILFVGNTRFFEPEMQIQILTAHMLP